MSSNKSSKTLFDFNISWLNLNNIQYDETSTPKHLSLQFMKADLTAQKERHTSKEMHGYYERKIDKDTRIHKHLSNTWKKDKFVTSQVKNYHSTIQDQELPTKYLQNKKARDSRKTSDCNNKCRLCTTNVEDINHIIASCSHISARYSPKTRRSSKNSPQPSP